MLRIRSHVSVHFCDTIIFVFLSAIVLLSPSQSNAFNNPETICDQATVLAAKETNVPIGILRTISRAKTDRDHVQFQNLWPWTVNITGKGVWFDNEDQARIYVFENFKKGARSFDVGCFQVNYKWHGQEFNSIDEMFDPILNALFAANFLNRLYSELGDWNKAVGAYHARTHKHSRQKFTKIGNNFSLMSEPARSGQKDHLSWVSHQSQRQTAGSLMPFSRVGRDTHKLWPQGLPN